MMLFGSTADFRRFEAVDGKDLRGADLIAQGIVVEPLKLFAPRSSDSASPHKTIWQECIATGPRLRQSLIVDTESDSAIRTLVPHRGARRRIDADHCL